VSAQEGIAPLGGIEIAYEVMGDASAQPLLMIMGLGMPLTTWDDDLCAMFAERGFRVIRFDNRDSGRSTKVVGGPRPNVVEATLRIARSASYTLEDMAGDCAGLLSHLGIQRAHVLGVSLGGMIAQTLAIEHPDRVLSLASIMSTTGNPRVARSRPRAGLALLSKAPDDREGYVEHSVKMSRIVGSKGFVRDEERARERLRAGYDRGRDPIGSLRQLLAIVASGDRTKALSRLRVPTVVIHGLEDPLVPPSGGRATARAIPDARLVEIAGMGHDLPRGAWPRIVDAVADNAARATGTGEAFAASSIMGKQLADASYNDSSS
jgi:pimeloyl-ACP methyl ester carboxylesterase